MYKEIVIGPKKLNLEGHIVIPKDHKAWVIFVHGSGSSRKSKRNNWVANKLNEHGYATLLFDLLTPLEDLDFDTRFDIPLLTERLLMATDWLINSSFYYNEPIAYFGASTGAAAALSGAATLNHNAPLFTVISRGGRPDLASKRCLNSLKLPVLLIVGEKDEFVLKLNRKAAEEISLCDIQVVSEATHLFEEPGALQKVVVTTVEWLDSHLPYQKREISL